MSDKQKHKNPRIRQNQKFQAAPQTAEERAAALAAHQKAEAEAKAERERIELFGKSVGKMSHRQLRGELKRLIRREYAGKPPEPQAGLNICLASIFLTVLENTHTVVEKHTRPDQINPNGRLHAYPR
jgi:hypothetical protein